MLVPLEQKFAGGLVLERDPARVEEDRELVPRALDADLCIVVPSVEVDLLAFPAVKLDLVQLLLGGGERLVVLRYGMPYISIAAVYDALALATTVLKLCR